MSSQPTAALQRPLHRSTSVSAKPPCGRCRPGPSPAPPGIALASLAGVGQDRPESHETLVRRACAGDDLALSQLVELYHDSVYRYGRSVCRDIDLDDAVQDAFVSLTRFRSEFRGDASIGTWLFTTVRNACRQLLRPVARRRRLLGDQVEMDGLDDVNSDVLGPEELAIRAELVSTVHVALEALSPEHRQILILRDIEGVSGPDTAHQLGLTIEATKSRLVRARAALRTQILRTSRAVQK